MEVVDSWTTGAISRAKCSQIITTNKPTSSFLQAGCPSCRPTNSVKALKGKISHSMGLVTPSSPGVFQLHLWPLIVPGYLEGGLPCLSSALWCQYPMSMVGIYTINLPGRHRGFAYVLFQLWQAAICTVWGGGRICDLLWLLCWWVWQVGQTCWWLLSAIVSLGFQRDHTRLIMLRLPLLGSTAGARPGVIKIQNAAHGASIPPILRHTTLHQYTWWIRLPDGTHHTHHTWNTTVCSIVVTH